MQLARKVALITGGGSGMGRATAELFHREGAKIAIVGRRADKLEKAAASIGDGVLCCPCDVTDENAVRSMVSEVFNRFGRIDVSVFAAGVNPSRTEIASTELDKFNETLATSVSGTFLVTREVAAVMSSGSAIVLIGSIAALRGYQNLFPITAAKGALHAMTRQLARTLGKEGIRVNLVAPGLTRTEMTAPGIEAMSEEVYASVVASYPLGKIGEPEDIANACLYLASDEAKWVTGVVLPVDGGLTA